MDAPSRVFGGLVFAAFPFLSDTDQNYTDICIVHIYGKTSGHLSKKQIRSHLVMI